MSRPPSAPLTPPQFHFPASPASSSIITVIIIVASAVTASATIYLLLRFLSNRLFHAPSFSIAVDDVVSRSGGASSHVASRGLLDYLPLFSFRSVTGNIDGAGHCAVCLSKFDPDDRLRLLPLCCHVFHADCIDVWIASNQTCPLCRSTVLPCGSDALDKILVPNNPHESAPVSGGSFRIEIGSISRRTGAVGGGERQSYALGSFEYVVHENECEVPVDCTSHWREVSDDVKFEIPTPEAEVSIGRSWLREYVDKISSRATSFRSSGRMFAGSISCRSEAVIVPEDLEVTRIGDELG